MAKKNTDVLEQRGRVQKTWTYNKGKVGLEFSLFIDIKQDMKDFVECLEGALISVKEEIAKVDENKTK